MDAVVDGTGKSSSPTSVTEHKTVLRHEVTAALLGAPRLSQTSEPRFLDLTLGGGGHSAALLAGHPRATVFAIDRDAEALQRTDSALAPYRERIRLLHGNFADVAALVRQGAEFSHDAMLFDGVVADLGLSSDQLGAAARGFSFREEGPLDMRMDLSMELTAEKLLNESSPRELERMFRNGDVGRFSGALANLIVQRRPLRTTTDLARICEAVIRPSRRDSSRRLGATHHPATVPFQALRMAVNDELGSLRRMLEAIPNMLASGARFAAISFHSLEDKEVARAMRRWARVEVELRRLPLQEGSLPLGKLLTKSALTPGESERSANPRARSAMLRIFERH